MVKRHLVRNKSMEDHVYFLARHLSSNESRVAKLSLDSGDCTLDTAYAHQNGEILALEVDPESENHFYVLDNEQSLTHLVCNFDGKLMAEASFDLSKHKIENELEKFRSKHLWDCMLIDNRSITIRSSTYSLYSDFSFKFKKFC